MAPRIRVIGSLTLDHVSITSRFPAPGETVAATDFFTNPGGKGANQAVAAGRLSRRRDANVDASSSNMDAPVTVEMVGAVGALDTLYEEQIKPELERSGVDTSRMRILADGHTGVTMIIVDSSAGGENRILFSGRANYQGMQPVPEVIDAALAAPVPDIIVMQGEIPVETVIAIMRQVAALKKKGDAAPEVIYNPAPVPPNGLPADVWAGVDHLIMNETEAELMMPKSEQLLKAIPDADQLEEKDKTARFFHQLGVTFVLITLGAKGAWYSAAEGGKSAGSVDSDHRFSGHVPASKADTVVDTTAAGDTFVGAYAVHIARWQEQRRQSGRIDQSLTSTQDRKERYGETTEAAMRFAAIAAARCVERPGAMSSIPWGDEI